MKYLHRLRRLEAARGPVRDANEPPPDWWGWGLLDSLPGRPPSEGESDVAGFEAMCGARRLDPWCYQAWLTWAVRRVRQ